MKNKDNITSYQRSTINRLDNSKKRLNCNEKDNTVKSPSNRIQPITSNSTELSPSHSSKHNHTLSI